MNVVWRKNPATVRAVVEGLGRSNRWAYTTVKTLLTRLAAKGALRVTKTGNASVFAPILQRSQARRTALASLVNAAFDGALLPMLNFLLDDQKLTDRDRAALEEALRKLDADKPAQLGREADPKGDEA